MARMVVIYATPADPAAFDAHYFDIHVPMARKLPGLRKYVVSHGPIAAVAGGQACHLIAELHFDDLDALRRAFATPEGQACAADRRMLAPRDADVQMYLFETREV